MSDAYSAFTSAQDPQQELAPPPQTDYQTSYAGDRRTVDPAANTDADGKRRPFYESKDFYNNLLNFGASTLAANAEPGMNAFGAIGRGVLGAVEANRNEREAQASIRGQNAQQGLEQQNARYRGVELGLQQRKLDMINQVMHRNYGIPLSQDTQGQTPAMGQQTTDDIQQQARLPEAPLLTGIAHVESRGNPGAMNKYGYSGLYGLGTAALQTAGMYTPAEGENVSNNSWQGTVNVPGYGAMTHQQFLNNPGAQTAAMHGVLHSNAQTLEQNGALNYVGKTMPDGTQITMPALLAGAQIAGPTGMLRYLQTGKSSADGNGTTIPQYISAVNDAMQQAPQQTADAVHDAQASAGHQLLGGSAALGTRIQQLQSDIMTNKMLGLGTAGQEAELNNIYALQKAGYQADLDRQTHAANKQYDITHSPVGLRDSVGLPTVGADGNLTGMRFIKSPHPTESIDLSTGLAHQGFNETDPNGNVQFKEVPGAITEGKGLEAEDVETTHISGKLREESVQKMDAAKQNLSTLQSYQDNLGNIQTGPGESYLLHLKTGAMAAMRAAGMTISPDMEKTISSAQNVSSLAGALNAHMFSSVHNVKNTVEFKSLQSAIPGLDNTPESLQFILSHGQGESLEDLAESSFLQGPAQNQQKFPQFYKRGVFDANKALADFHKNVSPMSYTYMLLNSSPSGRRMIGQMMSGDKDAISSRLTAAQKSLAWMRDNGVLFNAQGNQD